MDRTRFLSVALVTAAVLGIPASAFAADTQAGPPPVPGACGPGSLCAPPVIDPWPGPIPPGYHASSKPNPWLTGVGAGFFGLPYILHVALVWIDEDMSHFHDGGPILWLLVPVAGPFIELQYTGFSAILVVDGSLQALGAVLMAVGQIVRVPFAVRNDVSMQVVPSVIALQGGGYGFGLRGSF